MQPVIRRFSAGWLFSLALLAPVAHAGLFDDDEARKAILDLRQKIDQIGKQQQAADAKSAPLVEQVNQLKSSLLDLNNQLELMRSENAKLRGQNEQLTRDVSDLQRLQKDVQQGVEERMRKFEPQQVSFEGKDFLAEPEEKRQFDDAMATLRKGDFAAAAAGLSAFQQRYPSSGYGAAALYWLGNAQYGMRDYREAMNSFRSLLAKSPDSPRAPEALLSVANCQIELKDSKGARKTLDDLRKTYPKSEAAQAARERLASLK
jgi:tol-pal system protein YbgF